jgi:SPX domain protein involved in polyphosphate accumulation
VVAGFRKITKKHDKLTGLSLMPTWMDKIGAEYFNTSTRLDPVITEIGICLNA